MLLQVDSSGKGVLTVHRALAILVLLALLFVPWRTSLAQDNDLTALTEIAGQLEAFYKVQQKFPDGWDLLVVEGGAIYPKLSPDLTKPNSIFTVAQLTEDQVTSVKNAGINHIYLHDVKATDPSSSGTDRRHLGTGTGHDNTANVNNLVVIDKSSGGKGLNLLINDFGLNPNRAASDTTLPRISANTYVVFGLGPKSSMVQSQIQEAPILEHNNSATAYSRALAVFEIPNTGTTAARLVGVLGPDGRSKQVSLKDYESPTGPTAH